MEREFRKGYLEIDFPPEPFDSVGKLLLRSVSVFFTNFGFLAGLTLIVFLPAKAALQFACYLFDVPTNGLLSYLVVDLSDLILGALVVPAAVYGLMEQFRSGNSPPLRQSLRWGRRQWAKTLWNKFKVEVTVALWGALLVIPGLVAMVQLTFTDPVVAIEADRATDVLERSRELSKRRRWRIFFVLLPVMALDLVGSYLVLGAFAGETSSRAMIALVDSLLSVGGQWSTVVVLLMYLGLVPAEQPVAKRTRSAH